MGRLLDGLDHPVVFIVFVTMAVFGTKVLLEYGFKSLNWTGPAAVVE